MLCETEDPCEFCAVCGLRYVSDAKPGISRRRLVKSFAYFLPDGTQLADEAALARIRSLAIPPAYERVWICPHPKGHLQATGYDARGRKQYRYHALWTQHRNASKFGHLKEFVEALPVLRETVERDLCLPGLQRRRVLALMVRLLETTLIRVGNAEYARTNESYGLTTMQCRHVVTEKSGLRLRFRGKSGKDHDIAIEDRRAIRLLRGCMELPGQELFQYLDEVGAPQTVGSADVNEYLREITGQPFTAKNFRTWGGTLMATRLLLAAGECATKSEATRKINECVRAVAQRLGNTPAVCRKYYIHPRVVELFESSELARAIASRRQPPKEIRDGFREEELALWRLLCE